MMVARILIPIATVLFIWVFLKYFERKNIYFPTKIIEITPEDVGLKYEDVFFKTEDGVTLNGWFIPAKKSELTLLFCHGNGGNISHRLESIKSFHNIGLNVFIFDYREYGRSNGRVSEEGTYLDALAAYNYLLSREDVNRDGIIVFGRSLGGNVAIDLATKVEVSALICEGTFTSIMDMTKDIYKVRIPARFLSHRYDALTRIKEVDAPKLIIHSRDDEMIGFEHGKRLFEATKEPKEFYKLRGGHNEAFLIAGEEYPERIKSFIEKYL